MIENLEHYGLFYKLTKDKKVVRLKKEDYNKELNEAFKPENRIVKQENIKDSNTKDANIFLSTVFLGLDHSFPSNPDKPVVFETMIFGGEFDQYQRRYCEYDEALDAHDKISQALKENKDPDFYLK